MKQSAGFKFILLLSLIASPAAAIIPEGFKYNGKPIDPLCLIFEQENVIDLKKCTRINAPVETSGDNVTTGADDDTEAMEGSYEFLGMAADKSYFIHTEYGTAGSSGRFTQITRVIRKGNQITGIIINRGDRCNGGIDDASFEGNKLHYSQNLTPPDILNLADQNIHHLEAYKDLQANAHSCYGTVNYVGDNIESISLSEDLAPENDAYTAKHYTYQICFNKVFNQYTSGKNPEITLKELKQFANKFYALCLKK